MSALFLGHLLALGDPLGDALTTLHVLGLPHGGVLSPALAPMVRFSRSSGTQAETSSDQNLGEETHREIRRSCIVYIFLCLLVPDLENL